jgi:hypothetical protein
MYKQDLDREKETRRSHGSKPSLNNTRPKTSDPTLLKQNLLEKEAKAAANRAKELDKIQSKLARAEEHARKVQERKKALGRASSENLNLSWGGEAEVEEGGETVGVEPVVSGVRRSLHGEDTVVPLKETKKSDSGKVFDTDSGIGSRSTSGRSVKDERGNEILTISVV